MEQTSNQEDELFKNIAIATVVSINDVNKVPIISENKSIIDDIAVAIAVSYANQNADPVEPSNLPEPVHNVEEAIAIAVVRSSQNEDGETQSNRVENQQVTSVTSDAATSDAATITPGSNQEENENCDLKNFIKKGDETEKYIASELIGFLDGKIKIVNQINGETEKINLDACGEIKDKSLKKNTKLNETLEVVKDYLSTIYEL